MFTGLGKLETPYRIRVDTDVQPAVHPPRRIPVAIHSALKEKLDEMVADGVIAPVTEATDWVSSMVVVHKPSGALRICIDPKHLNQAIKREHYHLPTMEKLTTRLGRAKVFTVLDASNGFWQIPLDDKSSMLTCFNTPFGRFKWLRMPFGLNSAPEVWQRRMHEIVEGLPGTEVMFDDFLIIGRGDTLKQAVIDHDQNLIKFFKRAREINLKLKAEKMRFRLQEVPFIGHMLTADGLAPSPEKIRAILEMRTPTDVPSLQRFLGMVNYFSKFVPKLSDHAELLRTLTVKGADWKWLPEHEKAFQNLKSLLTSPPVLRYYDVHLPVVLQCDASDTWLGAVLLQEGLPVMYSSIALTATERNYAQIEKELLAIVFAAENFDKYIYALNVQVQSDHKPLETIFSMPLHTAPKRLQRMLLRLQCYDLHVSYQPDTEMHIADMLSRAYLEGKPSVCALQLQDVEPTDELSVSPQRLGGLSNTPT